MACTHTCLSWRHVCQRHSSRPVHGRALVAVSYYVKGDSNLTLSVSSHLIIPAAVGLRCPKLSVSVLLCCCAFAVDVEERTHTHPCARAHNPIYRLLYLPRYDHDILHSTKFKCLRLPFWVLLHSVFCSFPFRRMLFFTGAFFLFFLLLRTPFIDPDIYICF